MKQMERRIKSGVLFLPIFIGGVFLFTWILMLLWNAVLPAVTGVKVISFWQAMGIFALAKILFGFGGGWGGRRHRWRERWNEKWDEKVRHMSDEDRLRFRDEWRQRCGGRWANDSSRIDPEVTGVE